MSDIQTDTRRDQEEVVFSDREIADMSFALVSKYGAEAINIAAFFLDEHLEMSDHVRAESWLRVMTYLDQQYQQRLSDGVVH